MTPRGRLAVLVSTLLVAATVLGCPPPSEPYACAAPDSTAAETGDGGVSGESGRCAEDEVCVQEVCCPLDDRRMLSDACLGADEVPRVASERSEIKPRAGATGFLETAPPFPDGAIVPRQGVAYSPQRREVAMVAYHPDKKLHLYRAKRTDTELLWHPPHELPAEGAPLDQRNAAAVGYTGDTLFAIYVANDGLGYTVDDGVALSTDRHLPAQGGVRSPIHLAVTGTHAFAAYFVEESLVPTSVETVDLVTFEVVSAPKFSGARPEALGLAARAGNARTLVAVSTTNPGEVSEVHVYSAGLQPKILVAADVSNAFDLSLAEVSALVDGFSIAMGADDRNYVSLIFEGPPVGDPPFTPTYLAIVVSDDAEGAPWDSPTGVTAPWDTALSAMLASWDGEVRLLSAGTGEALELSEPEVWNNNYPPQIGGEPPGTGPAAFYVDPAGSSHIVARTGATDIYLWEDGDL